jgi:MFS transporter, OFA family, oxalate/formate antiporter
MSKQEGGARWLVVIGAVMIQLILGTVYGYSIFWDPLTAEVFPPIVTAADVPQLAAEGADLAGYTIVADAAAATRQKAVQQGYVKYAFSICILTFAIVMVIAGRVQDLKGPRFPAIVGGVLIGSGFILAGLMKSPVVFYVAHAACTGAVALVVLMIYHAIFGKVDVAEVPIVRYVPQALMTAVIVGGVVLGNRYVGQLGATDKLFLLWGSIGFMAGAGIGFAYVCPIAALVKWFPKQKGLVSGIAVAGFGFGAYLFKGENYGALGFIRENSIVPFFLVHGAVCLVAITLGAMLLRNPPGVAAAATSTDSKWQDTLRRPAFYLLWLMFFSGALAGLMVIGVVKPFVQDRVLAGGLDAVAASAVGAAAVGYLAIFNAIGRIVWGFVSDRVGRTVAFTLMFLLQAGAMFALGHLHGALGLSIVASIVGFNFGGNFALFPSATADLFGAKNLGANYGWVFTSYGIAGRRRCRSGQYGQGRDRQLYGRLHTGGRPLRRCGRAGHGRAPHVGQTRRRLTRRRYPDSPFGRPSPTLSAWGGGPGSRGRLRSAPFSRRRRPTGRTALFVCAAETFCSRPTSIRPLAAPPCRPQRRPCWCDSTRSPMRARPTGCATRDCACWRMRAMEHGSCAGRAGRVSRRRAPWACARSRRSSARIK